MPIEIVDRFAADHFILNSITEQRQRQVRSALTHLAEFIEKPLEDATDADLRAWLVSLLQEGREPSTVAWYLKMALPFYRWCRQAELIGAEAYWRIHEVKAPRGSGSKGPRPYSRKELGLMWAQLEARFPHTTPLIIQRWQNGTSPWRSVKKHAMRLQLEAIIELALVCGLRRNEIYRLSIDDCHWDNAYIVVHGKRVDQNDKVREVSYPDSTRRAITAWLRFRAQLSPEPGCMWLSITGPDPAMHLNYQRMANILHSFGPWTLHRMRHTCATERLRAGMKLEHLKEFLGHANIQQTLAYAGLVRDDIHRASARVDADFQKAIRRAA